MVVARGSCLDINLISLLLYDKIGDSSPVYVSGFSGKLVISQSL